MVKRRALRDVLARVVKHSNRCLSGSETPVMCLFPGQKGCSMATRKIAGFDDCFHVVNSVKDLFTNLHLKIWDLLRWAGPQQQQISGESVVCCASGHRVYERCSVHRNCGIIPLVHCLPGRHAPVTRRSRIINSRTEPPGTLLMSNWTHRGRFRTAPVFIPGTPLKPTHLQKHA